MQVYSCMFRVVGRVLWKVGWNYEIMFKEDYGESVNNIWRSKNCDLRNRIYIKFETTNICGEDFDNDIVNA